MGIFCRKWVGKYFYPMFWTILNTLVGFIFSKNLIVRLPIFLKKNFASTVFLWMRQNAGHEILNDDDLNR